MPTATPTNTTSPPSRRALFGAGAAILAGGALAATMNAAPPIATAQPDSDAELIALCDQFVSIQTEYHLLMEHDDWVADFGPNNARYEHLSDEHTRLADLIESCPSPKTPAGWAAMARAAITWVTLDTEGNFMTDSTFEDLLVRVAEAVAIGFVWPPRPGSCSTVHWAPPPTQEQIDEHVAANAARFEKINAQIETDKLAAAAERLRRTTPVLMTDGELSAQAAASRTFVDNAGRYDAELTAELARRGLA